MRLIAAGSHSLSEATQAYTRAFEHRPKRAGFFGLLEGCLVRRQHSLDAVIVEGVAYLAAELAVDATADGVVPVKVNASAHTPKVNAILAGPRARNDDDITYP
jgi:hypothetical protein